MRTCKSLPGTHVELLADHVIHIAYVGPGKKDAKITYVYLDSSISKRCAAKWLLDGNAPRRFRSLHLFCRSVLKAT